ncbi:MAG: LysR family transcriptional regulator [Gordonibacter sp.]|nr:LysR family transcriptional regulator [Gordonibacter sp.]
MGNQKYEAFLKVIETGSFKQAARELGYTQAGISYLVNALEREFGMPLLVREYGGAHPTSDGAAIMEQVQDVCNAERRLEARLVERKHLEGGSVHVATFTSTAIQWLPGIAKRFEELHPAINLDLTCIDDQDELEEMVWRGDADCGFAVFPIKQDLHMIPLLRDPLLVAIACDHPLAQAPCFPAEALANEPYVRLESGVYSEMDELFRRNEVEPRVRFTIASDYAVMSLVSAGLGYSVLPGLILRDTPFPLVSMPPEVPTDREIAVCVRSLETASAATRAFLDITKNWVETEYGTGI